MEVKDSHKVIYENEKVNRWYMNNRQGSPISADIWRRNLALYCEVMKTTPDGILEQAKKKKLEESFEKFRDMMLKKGRKGAYIEKFRQVLRSWTSFNKIDYRINLKIKNANKNETTENERVPMREELSKFLLLSAPRGKVSISLMAFSGLRPESLGNYEGDDGLVLGDLEDLDIKSLTFRKIPAKLNIRSSISKADNNYFSFMNEEGCMHILDYLNRRKEEGEILKPESPLLQIDLRGAFKISNETKERKSGHTFLRTSLITREIRDAIRSAGMQFRPYILRAFFATAMDRAEYNGLISHSWRQFLMGHKGDIEAVYSTNKRLLPEQIEEMRSAYQRASKYLEPEPKGLSEGEMEKKFRTQLLLMAGFTEEEIKEKNLLDMTAEEITRMAREKLLGMNRGDITALIEKDKQELSKNHKQKVVSIDVIEQYINSGFIVKMALGNDRAIVEMP